VFSSEPVKVRGYEPRQKASDLALNEIIGLIEKSERPVLYCGGGIITGEASEELRKFVELTRFRSPRRSWAAALFRRRILYRCAG